MTARRAAGLASVAAALLTLSACSIDVTSTEADLDAAVDLWGDPWLAGGGGVPGPRYGSNDLVDRTTTERSTRYRGELLDVVRSELRVADAAGWRPTSSTCSSMVSIALIGPRGALASLVAAPTPGESGAPSEVSVVVKGVVPHHLDDDWPQPTPEVTCLDGASSPFTEPPITGRVLGGDRDDGTDAWQDDTQSADVRAAVAEAVADEALQALGLRVVATDIRTGANYRTAPSDSTAFPGTLGELVQEMPGWRLTFAACGGGGQTLATFTRRFGDEWAVLEADLPLPSASSESSGSPVLPPPSDAPPADPAGDLRVTLPMTEGPDGDWLADLPPLDDTTCLGDAATVAALPRQTVGTFAALPIEMTPIER